MSTRENGVVLCSRCIHYFLGREEYKEHKLDCIPFEEDPQNLNLGKEVLRARKLSARLSRLCATLKRKQEINREKENGRSGDLAKESEIDKKTGAGCDGAREKKRKQNGNEGGEDTEAGGAGAVASSEVVAAPTADIRNEEEECGGKSERRYPDWYIHAQKLLTRQMEGSRSSTPEDLADALVLIALSEAEEEEPSTEEDTLEEVGDDEPQPGPSWKMRAELSLAKSARPIRVEKGCRGNEEDDAPDTKEGPGAEGNLGLSLTTKEPPKNEIDEPKPGPSRIKPESKSCSSRSITIIGLMPHSSGMKATVTGGKKKPEPKPCSSRSITKAPHKIKQPEPKPCSSRSMQDPTFRFLQSGTNLWIPSLTKRTGEVQPLTHSYIQNMPGVDYPTPVPTAITSFYDRDKRFWICLVCREVEPALSRQPMISCAKCGDWYHLVCVGIHRPFPQHQPWYCRRCIFAAGFDFDFP